MGFITPIDEMEFLVALVRLIKPMVAVEVGVCRGDSTVRLAAALPPGGVLYGLENESEEDLSAAERRIAEWSLRDKIVLVRGDSKQTIPSLPDGIGFAFVDGNHEYDGVKADYEALWPKMVPGGIIAFHDVSANCGVRDFIPKELPHAVYLPHFQGLALIQKMPVVVLKTEGGTLPWS